MFPSISDPKLLPYGCLNYLPGSEVVDRMDEWKEGENGLSVVLVYFPAVYDSMRDKPNNSSRYRLPEDMISWFNVQEPNSWFYLHNGTYQATTSGKWHAYAACQFYFSDADDALLFKLAWSNDVNNV